MHQDGTRTYVLVHGAWHGGWCWRRVADALRTRGHRVVCPTLTGLGERSHLLSTAVDVNLHGRDIVNVLRFEDLSDVVLVGHSYGGPVISSVADAEPGRIRRLVYLDAALLGNGEALMDGIPPAMAAERIAAAIDVGGVPCMPIPPAASFGVTAPEDVIWLERHLTPQPLACFRGKLALGGPPGNGLPADYIAATDPVYGHFERFRQRARDWGHAMREIAAGHDAMVTAPSALADVLES